MHFSASRVIQTSGLSQERFFKPATVNLELSICKSLALLKIYATLRIPLLHTCVADSKRLVVVHTCSQGGLEMNKAYDGYVLLLTYTRACTNRQWVPYTHDLRTHKHLLYARGA